MNIQTILQNLKNKYSLVNSQVVFSNLPGIYAFHFVGKKFPLNDFTLPDDKIVYIGKTERSQKSRDADTHFKSGKSGSSTVRKSVGALLSQNEEIISVIRSSSDIEKGRKSHFKFDDKSEQRITEWMLENIAVSFFEYSKCKTEIDTLETEIIQVLKPVLNIDYKNPDNPFKNIIKELRKKLAIKAHSAFISNHKTLGKVKTKAIVPERETVVHTSEKSGKYTAIWEAYFSEITFALESSVLRKIIMIDEELFQQAGNRNKYSFTVRVWFQITLEEMQC